MAFMWLWHKPPKKRPRRYRLRPAGPLIAGSGGANKRPRSACDGPGVSLVKIEKAHRCRVDRNLTVVKIAVNKTGRAILISGRLRA